MTRDEILDALEDERERFLDAIEGLSDDALQQSGIIDDWSVKDILFHISMWEAELIKLLWQVSHGQKPTSIHFTDLSVDEINSTWQQQGRQRPLALILEDFRSVRKQTSRLVQTFSDRDLNDNQRYSWSKGSPLWEWIAENSFGHEGEHTNQIRTWRGQQGI